MKRLLAFTSGVLAWNLSLSLAKILYIVFLNLPITKLNYFVMGYATALIPCFIVIWVVKKIDKNISKGFIYKFIGCVEIVSSLIGVLNPFKPSDVPFMVITSLGTLLSVFILSRVKVLNYELD